MIFVVVVFVVVWSGIAKIDKVVRAEGRVVPSRQTQVIQSFEGGIVKKILVKEGDIVNEGDSLVEIDPTILVSQYNQSLQQYYSELAKAMRMSAEIRGVVPEFSDQLKKEAPAAVLSQTEFYKGRKAQNEGDGQVLYNQLVQRKQELNEIHVLQETSRATIASMETELGMITPLVQKGIESQMTLLQLQRNLNEVRGKMAQSEQSVIRLTAGIAEVEQKIAALKGKFHADTLGELAVATAQISELEQTLPALKERVERTAIRSPIKGVVNRVLLSTIGGVATSAQPLLEIVPIEDSLQIEATVLPKDIGFVHIGQRVLVKISAYDFSRFGGLEGKVTNISADVLRQKNENDNKAGYKIEISTKNNFLASNTDKEKYAIIPGMVAEVNIVMGKRSVAEYLLGPIFRLKENALSE